MLLVLAAMVGCCGDPEVITYSQIVKLPRQWEVPVVYIRLPREMSEWDYELELAKALCREFSVRVYDAFDGQVYIARFEICSPSVIQEKHPGVINLYQNDTVLIYHTETIMGDPPDRPGYAYVPMPTSLLNIDSVASAMMHEWLHAYVGLGDEYKPPHTSGSHRTIDCPELPYSEHGIKTNACIMDHDDTRRELCLPQDHNPDTDQGKESCYEYAARVLAEHRLALITIPKDTIPGPTNPPTPRIDVRLK